MTTPAAGTGFVAVSSQQGKGPDLAAALAAGAGAAPTESSAPGLQVGTWGGVPLAPGAALVLTEELRRHERELDATAVGRMLTQHDPGLGEVLPTFAAVVLADGALTACTDALGFRHLYYRTGAGWAAVSTSARMLALLGGSSIDPKGVAVQSMLGWQLRDRTLFSGVRKVRAGTLVTLRDGTLAQRCYLAARPSESLPLGDAVVAMRDMLRAYVGAYLDDHPDAILQLTGGQDSRLLLSAVDPRRRAGLRAVTLGRRGTPDVDIAARMSERYGLRHEILSLDGLDELGADELYERCRCATDALELGADPLARAALDFAESRALPGPRISGLGGEVARGFYYLGRRANASVTATRARRLAEWRMFANEAAEPAALHPDFRGWAREFAIQEVQSIVAGTGRPWLAATDELYLAHRMQRWAGVTETAVSAVRRVVNPMLDDRWIRTADAVSPSDKAGSTYLARIQVALDEELAALPLDGRPSPATFASPSRWAGATQRGAAVARKAARKAAQRAVGGRRAPAGGDVVAAGVVQSWRARPELLGRLAEDRVVSAEWVDDLLAGRTGAAPATVAFVMNYARAQETVDRASALDGPPNADRSGP